MAVKIRVLIVDDMEATRENIRKLLDFHPEIQVAGMADSGEAAIALVQEIRPDVVLMDINMPGMDGITATEKITAIFPAASVIIMSVQGEQEYLRRSLVAGAKDYLVKPFSSDELVQSIRQAFGEEQRRRAVPIEEPEEQGKVICLFSPKGGTGKTTIAVNLALALAEKSGETVGILDADLQFGDVAMFLALEPRSSVADLLNDIDRLSGSLLQRCLTPYNEKVQVLAAPLRVEQAAIIHSRHLHNVIQEMRENFGYIVVDTESAFNDNMVALLDEADEILLVSGPGRAAVKNMRICLDMLTSLGYTRDKMHLVLNRCQNDARTAMRVVARELTAGLAAGLPQDDEAVQIAAERRLPLREVCPESPVDREVTKLADWLLEKFRGTIKASVPPGEELGRGCG
ncbi:MAG TPA: response regulator [Patescibacteria group bacterium]|nr:response regulator [Patescibacteria group bacterium]